MFDIQLRPLKDGIFDPCCRYVPASVSPLHVTAVAFFAGLLSCYFATEQQTILSLVFWFLNRALDCLDGALARHRKVASDLGGFFDLLGDFVVYSILPLAVVHGSDDTNATWRAVASLEATFHINNFILFYVAAVAEKRQAKGAKALELTSLMMRPALIEGLESAFFFTMMLAFPSEVRLLSWTMAGLVSVGVLQRTIWIVGALGR